MMNFIKTACTYGANFLTEQISALGFTWVLICDLIIAMAMFSFAIGYCFDSFGRIGRIVIEFNRKRDFILILGYTVSYLALIAIIAFIASKVAFTFYSGSNILIPIGITLAITAAPIADFVTKIPWFVCTFKERHMTAIA